MGAKDPLIDLVADAIYEGLKRQDPGALVVGEPSAGKTGIDGGFNLRAVARHVLHRIRHMDRDWKWKLHNMMAAQYVELPRGSEILCAREQFEDICIWYRCDPSAPKEPRAIAIVGTGHPSPTQEQARYIGTASLRGGNLILHVFEKSSLFD